MFEPPPAPTKSTFGRDLVLLLVIPGFLMAGLLAWIRPWDVKVKAGYEVPGDVDIQDAIAGRWDWGDAESFCRGSGHTISFSEDRTLMHLVMDQPWTDSAGVEHREAVYELRAMSNRHVQGFMRGETRRTDAGELVVWDLVLTGPDTYAWHRTDWSPGGLTKENRRCPAEP